MRPMILKSAAYPCFVAGFSVPRVVDRKVTRHTTRTHAERRVHLEATMSDVHSHFSSCPVTLGNGFVSPHFFSAIVLMVLAAGAAIWGQVWLTILFGALLATDIIWVLYMLPENTFAVISRLEMIRPGVVLDGLHARVPGDEVHVIPRNPISIEIRFERQTSDGRMATGKIRVTVRPDPRIGDNTRRNRYATWVVQERQDGLREFAVHHVREAIEAPLKSMLVNMVGATDSVTLDNSLHGLALFVESEVGAHTPVHRDLEFLSSIGQPIEPPLKELLKWYATNHRKVAEKLITLDQEFEDNPEKPLGAQSVSHWEAHTSSTLEEVALIEFGYDQVTTGAAKDNFAGEKLFSLLQKVTASFIAQGVDPISAATLAAGVIGKADVKGNIVTGGNKAVAVVDGRDGQGRSS